MKTITLFLAFLIVTGATFAQKTPKTQTVVIHTSAECNECKERIEEALHFEKGVIFAELDIPSQNLTVKYNTKKTSLEKLRKRINQAGYDADSTKADPAAYEKLPECCKKGGHSHEEGGKGHSH